MSMLINQVKIKFNGVVTAQDTVRFSANGDDYCLTDGTIYAVTDEGEFLPGFKKARTLASVEKFIALRN